MMFKKRVFLFSQSFFFLLFSFSFSVYGQQDTGKKDSSALHKSIDLKEVEIKTKRSAFVMKKDTMEFDAAYFKTLPHSVLEDLLKRLPGVLIDASGNITVNGKKVNKIQVDGRDFFGGNTGMATKNLPSSIVDKIQVTEYKDPGKKYSQLVKPNSEEVVINMVLKADKKKGILGNVLAGYGSSDRYTGNGMLNAFQGKQRISIYGSAGNGNPELSSGSGVMMMASPGMVGGGGGGLNDYKSLMSNFNTVYSKKLNVDGNYGYSSQKNTLEKLTDRFNFLNDGGFSYNEHQNTVRKNDNHRLSANIEYTPDSLSNWQFMPGISYSPYQNNEKRKALSSNPDGTAINASDSRNEAEGRRWGFEHYLMFNKKSRNGKTTFRMNWNINVQNTDENQLNKSNNTFFSGSNAGTNNVIDQQGHSKETGISNTIDIELSRNLGGGFITGLQYRLTSQSSRIKKQVFNYDSGTLGYHTLDSLFSNDSKNTNFAQAPILQFAYRKNKLELALNAGMNIIDQQNKLYLKDTVISIHQKQFSPNLSMNYNFPNNAYLNFGYDINTTAPTTDQLAPVADPANPLVVLIGNPFLKTSLGHGLRLMYNRFVPKSGLSMYLMGMMNFTKNQIVTDVNYDSLGRQLQSYRNVNGSRSIRFNGGLQSVFHVQKLSIQPSVGLSVGNSKNIGYVNSQLNESIQEQYGGTLSIALNYKEYISLSPSANLSFNQTRYSTNPINNISYNTQNYALNTKISPFSRMEFSGQFMYQYNSQIPAGFQRSSKLLNSSMGYRFLKKEQLNFKIAVNDILNNNVGTTTTVLPTYRENIQSNALKRYFLFVLQYNFDGMSGGGGPKAITL